ncbi:MAG: 4-hydroxy-3-methylbut-2-enyl diphosphate reductase [Clostridia bacterium]|nr:4-hydroxy-3-methylbut-2-enyl diphosphate reductase [Clostridia bacterium]
MKITVAKSAGFCPGVRHAVDTALGSADSDTTLLGELIHNDCVNDLLKEKGVKFVDDIADIDTNKVILRSHGEKKDVIDKLVADGKQIVNTICPYVQKIHDIVREKYLDGYKVLIVGNANHPEIIAVNSQCDYQAQIIENETDVISLDIDSKYVLVSQTTFDVQKFGKICEKIQNLYPKSVVIFNTICYTTKVRQDEARFLASTHDTVFVIGARHSSNTVKLFNICKEICPRTYLIEKVSDAESVKKNILFDSLAITAGASTPNELIMEVTNIMSEEVKDMTLSANNETITMDDVMNSMKFQDVRAGKRVKCTVVDVKEEGIYVSFGAKKEGFVSKDNATIDGNYNVDDYKVDDTFEAIIIENTSKDKNYVSLSKKAVDEIIEGDKKAQEILSGNEFTVVCDRVAKDDKGNPKGLIAKVGTYTVFVPASHVRSGFVKNLDDYVGKKLRLRVLPPKDGEEATKKNAKRIVASQRVILEEEKAKREEEFWSSMVVGEVVTGKVKRFTDFGAFVSVNGFDCLARKMDLAWYKIDKPEDVLTLNEKYEFVVLSVDRENNKVSLGYKQLQPTPYEIAAQKYVVGDIIRGKVVRIYPFGAFVSIEPGVDGLVHVSQVSYTYIKDLNEALKVGDEVDAKIVKIDDKRITLSIKELLPEPVAEEGVEEEATEAEEVKPAKKPARRKTDADTEKAPKERKKPAREKKDDDGEPHEWISDNGAATLGDLFKDMTFDFESSDK